MFLWILLACSDGPPLAPPAPAVDVRAHMQGHRVQLEAIVGALALGDMPAAHAANEAFLDHEVELNLPGDWPPLVVAMGEASVALRDATTLPEATEAALDLADRCMACHAITGASPTPAAREGVDHGTMQQGAVDLLLSARWSPGLAPAVGAAALRAAQSDPMVASYEPLAAAVAMDPPDLGQVIGACATCHAGGEGGVFPIADAPTWAIPGGLARLVVGPREGSSRVAVQQLLLEAGATVPLHDHPASDELLVIHAGRVEMTLDGRSLAAGKGDLVLIPAGRPHEARVTEALTATQLYVAPGPERRFTAGEPQP